MGVLRDVCDDLYRARTRLYGRMPDVHFIDSETLARLKVDLNDLRQQSQHEQMFGIKVMGVQIKEFEIVRWEKK
jgi:hypothetical protein